MQLQNGLLIFSATAIVLSLAKSGETASIVTSPSVPPSLNGLTISTSEKELVPNVTDFVSVKCTYTKPSNSDVISVVSLIMSRWDGPMETRQELLAVTGFDPTTVIQKYDVGGRVDGHLDQKGESILTLSWDNPGKEVATRYMCSVSTIDMMGHPVTSEVQTELRLKSVDFSILIEALGNLKVTHQRDIQNLTHALEKERIKNLAQQKIINELELFHDYGFRVSGFGFDSQFLYWSAKGMPFHEAKIACEETGGKLAELPFKTLKSKEGSLKEIGIAYGAQLWVGLMRASASSPWVWASNGTQAGSVTWHQQPSSENRCAFYHPNYANGYFPYFCNDWFRALCSMHV